MNRYRSFKFVLTSRQRLFDTVNSLRVLIAIVKLFVLFISFLNFILDQFMYSYFYKEKISICSFSPKHLANCENITKTTPAKYFCLLVDKFSLY